MAQINVSLMPEEIAPGFRPMQVLNDAWTHFLHILESITTGLIWALVFAPLVAVPLGIVAIVWRLWRRTSKRTVETDVQEE